MANERWDVRGKVCLVTGANSGMGFVTARELARLGATVVMVSRDQVKGEAAQAAVKAQSGNANVELLLADLSWQQSIRELAATFQQRHDRLHVLVNNAGSAVGQRELTRDNLERTFATNHLAYFLLTNLLLDTIKASAPARIINVSSAAQSFGKLDFDDLQSVRGYNSGLAYGRSKLANVLFTYELARKLMGTGVTVNCLHPGGVRTNFGVDTGGVLGLLVKVGSRFMRTPEKGAETAIWLATDPAVASVSGKYFADKKEKRSAAQSYDEAACQRLWSISAQLTGLAAALGPISYT